MVDKAANIRLLCHLLVFLPLALLPAANAQSCSACKGTWDVVCATIDGIRIELPNACLARCQGATEYTTGECTDDLAAQDRISGSATAAPASEDVSARKPTGGRGSKRFRTPDAGLRIKDPGISDSELASMAQQGFIYVGGYTAVSGGSGQSRVRQRASASSNSGSGSGSHPPQYAVTQGVFVLEGANTEPAAAAMPNSLAVYYDAIKKRMFVQTKLPKPTDVTPPVWEGRTAKFKNTTWKQPVAKNVTLTRRMLGGVLGKDNRVDVSSKARQYPYSTVIQLKFQPSQQPGVELCTGALIAPNVILTAGHCVYDMNAKGWARAYELWVPDERWRLSKVKVKALTTFRGFVASPMESSIGDKYDVGLITLDANLGSERGWLGITWDCSSTASQSLSTVGFASDLIFNQAYAQQCSSKRGTSPCDDMELEHSCDTIKGQSGSPMYTMTKKGAVYIKAVLTCSYTDPVYPWNCGVWMRPAIWPTIWGVLNGTAR